MKKLLNNEVVFYMFGGAGWLYLVQVLIAYVKKIPDWDTFFVFQPHPILTPFFGAIIGGMLTLGGVFLTISHYRKQDIDKNCPYLDIRVTTELENESSSYFIGMFTGGNKIPKDIEILYEGDYGYLIYTLLLRNLGGPAILCSVLDIWTGSYAKGSSTTIVSDLINLNPDRKSLNSQVLFQILDSAEVLIGISKDIIEKNIGQHLFLRLTYRDKYHNDYLQEFDLFISKNKQIKLYSTLPFIRRSDARYMSIMNLVKKQCESLGQVEKSDHNFF